MKEFTATVIDPIGFHARPASKIVMVASGFKSDLIIHFEGKKGNLKSIMNIMALGIKKGKEFSVKAEGPDAEQALEAVQKSMRENNLID